MHEFTVLKPGPGFQPVRAAGYYAHRLVTWPAARRLVQRSLAFCINRTHPLRSDASSGPPAAEGSAEALSLLRRDGLTGMDPLVPQPLARAMAAYFLEREVVSPSGRMRVGELPAGTALAPYPLATVLACPGVVELINHPRVLDLAERYLGCTPTLSSLGARWSLPRPDRTGEVQQFHRDYDDWRSLKLFVYLTDVDGDTGPHLYVRGSHHTAGTLRARHFSLDAIKARFGGDSIQAVTGPAGTSFLADVHGVHCGAIPTARPRLILQAQYSILPIYAFRYDPVALHPPQPIDPYINRLLVRSP